MEKWNPDSICLNNQGFVISYDKKPEGEIEQEVANSGNHTLVINSPDPSHLSALPCSAFQPHPQVGSSNGHKEATTVPDITSSGKRIQEEKGQHLTTCVLITEENLSQDPPAALPSSPH